MKYSAESRDPSSESTVIVSQVAEVIRQAASSEDSWLVNYLDAHCGRIAHDLDMVTNRMDAGSHLLEIGCVPPLLTASLIRRGFAVDGVDVAPERYTDLFQATGVEAFKSDVEREDLPSDDGTYDAVVLNEVFEHLRIDLIHTLSEIHRVLKPGGRLFLSTPNLRSLRGVKNFVLANEAYSCTSGIYAQYEKLNTIGHMGHVREYTYREVSIFLERVGFSPMEIVHRGSYKSAKARLACSVFPWLRPFFSCIAVK